MIKRPLIWLLGVYLVGLLCAWYEESNLFALFFVIVSIASIYFFLCVENSRWKFIQKEKVYRKIIWLLPICLFMGFVIMSSHKKPQEVDKAFEEKEECSVSGTITMIVHKKDRQVLYIKDVLIYLKEESYTCENIMIYISQPLNYKVGNQIAASGSIQKFSKATNPGQFNEKVYYQIENIDYKMYATKVEITDGGYSIYYGILDKIKMKMLQVFEGILSPKESGVLIAMLLGDKYLLDDEINDLYSQNGIAHVIAISGMHLSFLGMAFYKILKKIKVPIYLSIFLSMFLIYSYGVMTHFSVSTKRAVVMMIVLLFGDVVGRTYDMLSATAFSALLLLIDNPMQLFHAGFLLSYSAILGICVLYPHLKEIFPSENPVVEGLLVSLSAQVTTLPFVLYFFYQVPTYGLLVNLIVLPFVSCMMLSGFLAGMIGCIFLPIGIFLVGGANYLLIFYEGICRFGTALPGSLITVGRPEIGRLLLFLLFMLLFLLGVRCCKKKWVVVLFLLGIIVLFIPTMSKELEITVIDVGQGDSIYIKSPYGTTYLVDGGSSNVKGVGTYRIEPFLLSQGVGKLDYMIITHSDYDHIGGAKEIIEKGKIRISHLILPKLTKKEDAYLELENLARKHEINISYITKGNVMIENDLYIQCLHPKDQYEPSSVNAYSTVLSLHYKEFDMLLTGDLELNGEIAVMELLEEKETWGSLWESRYNRDRWDRTIDYDVLKVAHHGSKNSTSTGFLALTQPEWSIISCSKKNSYGHPHPELLQRLWEERSHVMTTFEGGAIKIQTDGRGLEISTYLKKN